jgi:molybdenum cofactor biosynthesis protein A
MLTDRFNRIHNYLRISITDSCNFRCTYCKPETYNSFFSQHKLMTAEEIGSIAAEFVRLGIKKIRLTGGEPLLRKDFNDIVNRLSKMDVTLLLTTNGVLVNKHIDAIASSGIATVNVSLDTLQPEIFLQITKSDKFDHVWNNIMLLLKRKIRVKLNVVAIKGIINNEINSFIGLTKNLPLHVRFIEFMPFAGNQWHSNKVVTAKQMLEWVSREFDIVKLKEEPHATAKKYKVTGHMGTFAFITSMSKQFCSECSRIRLTADGKLKNCLFGKEEIDLLGKWRKGESIIPLIHESIKTKQAAMGGLFDKGYEFTDPDTLHTRSMLAIGG